MRILLKLVTAIPLLALAFSPAAVRAADPKPDAARGEVLAKQWCTRCHIIAAGQTSAVEVGAPSFVSIAQRPGNDQKWIATFLQRPHPPMPDLHLGRVEIADLIAYIQKQR